MSGPRAHGLTRIVLTAIGLNGVVLGAWLVVQGMMGPRSVPSYGTSGGAPLLGADWSWGAWALVDWLVMLALSSILIATAALRLSGLMGEPDSTNDSADELQPPSSPRRGHAVDRIDEPSYEVTRNHRGSTSAIRRATGCAHATSRSGAVRVAYAGDSRAPLPDRLRTRGPIQHHPASRPSASPRTG